MNQDVPLTTNEKAIKMVSALISAAVHIFEIMPIFLSVCIVLVFYIPIHLVLVGGFAYYLYISGLYYITLINDDNDMDDFIG